jgi:uncharacterized protein
MAMTRTTLALVAVLAAALSGRAWGNDPAITLDPPGAGTFVLDRAGLLSEEQHATLNALGQTLLDENATPLVVVTIESMADHWPHGDIRIETFAHLLFDQWEIGIVDLAGETWNTGILLLVSKGDRRARVQLGAGWGRTKDAECTRIMDRMIIPEFKRGRFGSGIVKGAEALDAMARGRALPSGAGTSRSGRSGGGASPNRHGGGITMLPVMGCFGMFVFVLITSVILVSFMQYKMKHSDRSTIGAVDDDEDEDRGDGGRRGNGGFWSGFWAGQWMSWGGFSSGGGGGHSSGGFSGGGFSGGGGGFSGGGFSGGGGASGGW